MPTIRSPFGPASASQKVTKITNTPPDSKTYCYTVTAWPIAPYGPNSYVTLPADHIYCLPKKDDVPADIFSQLSDMTSFSYSDATNYKSCVSLYGPDSPPTPPSMAGAEPELVRPHLYVSSAKRRANSPSAPPLDSPLFSVCAKSREDLSNLGLNAVVMNYISSDS